MRQRLEDIMRPKARAVWVSRTKRSGLGLGAARSDCVEAWWYSTPVFLCLCAWRARRAECNRGRREEAELGGRKHPIRRARGLLAAPGF